MDQFRTNPQKPLLGIRAKESLLKRHHDYQTDERNWGHASKFECHAMNAVLDLVVAEEKIFELETGQYFPDLLEKETVLLHAKSFIKTWNPRPDRAEDSSDPFNVQLKNLMVECMRTSERPDDLQAAKDKVASLAMRYVNMGEGFRNQFHEAVKDLEAVLDEINMTHL